MVSDTHQCSEKGPVTSSRTNGARSFWTDIALWLEKQCLLDLPTLIEKVWLAPLADATLEATAKGITQRYGLHVQVSRSMLEEPQPFPDSPIADD
jgi:hypothetical protein